MQCAAAARPVTCPSMCAPICRSGSITRPMGRRSSCASPVSTLAEGLARPAARPADAWWCPSARSPADVPGACRPRSPRPCTVSARSRRGARPSTPSARRQPSVARQSPAARKPRTRARTLGQRAQQQRAVRDRLVAGHAHRAAQTRRGGRDRVCVHGNISLRVARTCSQRLAQQRLVVARLEHGQRSSAASLSWQRARASQHLRRRLVIRMSDHHRHIAARHARGIAKAAGGQLPGQRVGQGGRIGRGHQRSRPAGRADG